jgi:hypothetical protein
MAKQEPSGEVPGVNVSGSQGAQVGTGNNQYNAWMAKSPLDPVALSALNPHIAVTRLQQLSHDELVDFFAKASQGDVSEILDVFLEADDAKVVAILGDINRRKATELLKGVNWGNYRIALPEAAEAIARKAAGLKWTDAEPLELVHQRMKLARYDAYARRYKNGRVFWIEGVGTYATLGVMDDYFRERSSSWRLPFGDQETALTSPFGTEGIRQKSSRGMVYSSGRGIFRVTDDTCYENEAGSGGWLGFPISERERNGQFGDRQMFEGGAIYSFYSLADGSSSFATNQQVIDLFPSGDELAPVSKETPVVSSSGKPGTVQRLRRRLGSDVYETAVYSWQSGAVVVAPKIWDYYSKLGTEKSWLGFPTRQVAARLWSSDSGAQSFETGAVFWMPGTGPIAVPAEVVMLFGSSSPGFPLTEEQPVGEDGSGRIQYFEKGVVTLRDGRREIWLRPDSDGDLVSDSSLAGAEDDSRPSPDQAS